MAHDSNLAPARIEYLPHQPCVFYGWFVVLGAFAVTFLGFGTAYTFSVFMGALQADFAASRGSISLVFSLAGFLYFSLGLLSGPLAERWGAQRLAAAGMLLIAVGLVAAGFARTLLDVYVAYGLGVGLGAGLSYVPAVGAVQRWFTRRRALASGLAVSGIGVGTIVMPALGSDRGLRLARCLCGSRRVGRGHWRRPVAAHRGRPAPSPPGAGRRSGRSHAAAAGGKDLALDRGPDAAIHQSLSRLPELLARRVRAVRPPRSLRRGAWRS